MMLLKTQFCTKALIDSAPGITLFDRCAAYQLNCSEKWSRKSEQRDKWKLLV